MESRPRSSKNASRIPQPIKQHLLYSQFRGEARREQRGESEKQNRALNHARGRRFIGPKDQNKPDGKGALAENSVGHALKQGAGRNQVSKMGSGEIMTSGSFSIRGKVASLDEQAPNRRAGNQSIELAERSPSVAGEVDPNVNRRMNAVQQEAPEKRSNRPIWKTAPIEVALALSQSLRGRSSDVGASGMGRPDRKSTARHNPRIHKSDVGPFILENSDGNEQVSSANKWLGRLNTLKDYLHTSPPRGLPKPAKVIPVASTKLARLTPATKNRKSTIVENPDTDYVNGSQEDRPPRLRDNTSTPASAATPASFGSTVFEVLEEVPGGKPRLINIVAARSRAELPLSPLRAVFDRPQGALAKDSKARFGIAKSNPLQNEFTAQLEQNIFIAGPECQDTRIVRKRKSLPALPDEHTPTSMPQPNQSTRTLQARVADLHETPYDTELKRPVAQGTNQIQSLTGRKLHHLRGLGPAKQMTQQSSQMWNGIKAIKTSQKADKLSQRSRHHISTRVREERSFTILPATDNVFDNETRQDMSEGFNISIPPSLPYPGTAQDNEVSSISEELSDIRLKGSPVRRIRNLQISAQKSSVSHISHHSDVSGSQVSQFSVYPDSPKVYEDGSRGVWGIDENGQQVELHELPAREAVEKICSTAGTMRNLEKPPNFLKHLAKLEIVKDTISMLSRQLDQLIADEATQRNLKEEALIQIERLKTELTLVTPRSCDQEYDLPSSPTLPATPHQPPKLLEDWRARWLETTEVLKEVVDVNVKLARELDSEKKAHEVSQADISKLKEYVERVEAKLDVMSADVDTIYQGCEKHAELNEDLNAAIAGVSSREEEVLRLREQLANNEARGAEELKIRKAAEDLQSHELLLVHRQLAGKEDDYNKLFERLVEKEKDRQRLFDKLEQMNMQLEETAQELQNMRRLLNLDPASLAKTGDGVRVKTVYRLSNHRMSGENKMLWTWKRDSKGA